MQFGFSFDDTPDPVFVELAHGTWNAPRFTHSQLIEALAASSVGVKFITGPSRALFAQGIGQLQEEQAALQALGQARDGGGFSLDSPCYFRRDRIEADPQAVAAFIRHCETFAGTVSTSSGPVIEYKTRVEPRMKTFGVYVENVGSLIVREHTKTHGDWPLTVVFAPYRDTLFLAHYSDDAATMEAPGNLWRPAYSADKIAMAKGNASVEPFVFQGRKYIITSISTHGAYAEGAAWTFCRLQDWNGPTYTYQEHNKVADAGRISRGDYRGLVISVRGQKCVIDGFAHFCDHRADLYVSPVTIDVDEQEEHEEQEEIAESEFA
jgi:hypothetical protein